MVTKTFQLEPLTCPSCSAKIEGALKRTEGVKEIEVLFNSSRVRVSFDETVQNEEEISKVIDKVGFDVLSVK